MLVVQVCTLQVHLPLVIGDSALLVLFNRHMAGLIFERVLIRAKAMHTSKLGTARERARKRGRETTKRDRNREERMYERASKRDRNREGRKYERARKRAHN